MHRVQENARPASASHILWKREQEKLGKVRPYLLVMSLNITKEHTEYTECTENS